MRSTWTLSLVILIFAGTAFAKAPPVAKKQPVTDTYFDKSIADDYRWMENADDADAKAWTAAQNEYARSVLDAIPSMKAIRARLKEIIAARPAEHVALVHRPNGIFALKIAPPKQQPLLVLLASADDRASEKVIVDPNELDASGKTTIDFYAPSLDGKKVAVSLSMNGTEDGTVSVWDTESKTKLGDVIPRVNGGTAGGSVSWNGDGTGFFYTRYPRGTERAPEDMSFYQQIWFHRMGTPTAQDTYSLGKELPRIAECALETSTDGKRVLAAVANGDGGEFAFYLFDGAKWTQIAKNEDRVVDAAFGDDNALFMLSRKDAPKGKLLRLAPNVVELAKATVIVPESEATIARFTPAATRVYIGDDLGGLSQLRIFGVDAKGAGKELGKVSILPVSSVGQILRTTGDEVLFSNQSYVDAPAWYRFSPQENAPKKTALLRTAVTDFSDSEVTREFATSKDGTKVPVVILHKKGVKLDGNNYALIYGYGGFGISLTPRFSEELRPWIEQGGVYALANIRGGGELGEAWHLAGNLTHKQNGFDDFAAAAQLIVSLGYTKPEKLAAKGGSNGGLLMGAMITQHPEMFRVVVSHVGLYDMLRSETTLNGQFNVTEYGTVKDRSQFDAMVAYSPYHHVSDGKTYPSILMPIGLNDPRVDVFHSRKMIARLQAASKSKRPILLRTSAFGHGMGSSLDERIELAAHELAFIVHELGMKYAPVSAKR